MYFIFWQTKIIHDQINSLSEKILEFSDDDEGGLSIKEDDNVMTSEENGKKEIKVLPCDTLAEPIQVDSNNKSIIDTSYLDTDKGTFRQIRDLLMHFSVD